MQTLRYMISIISDPIAVGNVVQIRGDNTPIKETVVHRFTVQVNGMGSYSATVNLMVAPMEPGQWDDLAYVPEFLRESAKELLIDAAEGYFRTMRHEMNQAADYLNRIKKF